MRLHKSLWVIFAVLAPLAGFIVVRARMFGANPGSYLVLGMVAALALLGIAYGVREGRRIARDGRRIGN